MTNDITLAKTCIVLLLAIGIISLTVYIGFLITVRKVFKCYPKIPAPKV